MYKLCRICLQNWYLVDALDIEVRGASALIGPTGAGKSSVQDAIKMVVTGNNANRLHLNASAPVRSERSVRDYCLGFTEDPAEGGKPLRERCESVVALVFRDEETGHPVTTGIALEARDTEQREDVLSRFIAPGYAYSVESFKRDDGDGQFMAPWEEISRSLRQDCPDFEDYRTSAERFTADFLASMSGPERQPNARHFLRAFSNAVAFKPIFDPTVFVREYILEPDSLDVERVRSSIATWQGFVQTIEELEARLRRLQRIEKRYRDWGRAHVRAVNARWTVAAAECRRIAADHAALAATLRRQSKELEVERHVLAERRTWVRQFDEELRVKRTLLHESDAAARLRQVEMETAMCERDRRDLLAAWQELSSAFSAASKLSPLVSLVPAAKSFAFSAAGFAGMFAKPDRAAEETLRGRASEADDVARGLLNLEGAENLLERLADDLSERTRAEQAEVERLESSLARAGRGGSPLSPETLRLQRRLGEAGIEAVALCDVVEVVERDWQQAVEALLGRGREALIVSPDRLHEAHAIMHEGRSEFHGCTLVKTTGTGSGEPRVPEASVLSALRTEDRHARAFLATRIGGFRKAESEADLERLDRAVMRNGKSTSGLGLGVQRELRNLVLGSAENPGTRETLYAEVRERREALSRMREDVALLREGARTVPGIVQSIRRAGMLPSEVERGLENAAARLGSLARDLKAVEESEEGALVEQVREAEAERNAYAEELAEEIEPRVEELQRAVYEARAKLDVQRGGLRDAVRAKIAATLQLRNEDVVRVLELDPDCGLPSAAELVRSFRESVRERDSKDARAWLAAQRNDAKAVAAAAESEAKREGAGAIRELSEYVANWRIDFPMPDGAPTAWGYSWTSSERAKLERNELRAYREHCIRAEEEMRQMLKEDLLTKLAEKFDKVRMRLDVLNGRLDAHRFTRQKYSFEYSVNQRYAKVHTLARRVAGSPDQAQAILSGKVEEDATFIDEAMQEIQALIEGAEETKSLSDYRNYFNFELFMTDEAGKRTSMSSRAVLGSTGEANTAFYVAIAASLASAYFPADHNLKPRGMGLVLFDEAMNNLDVRNTQALVTFFRDIGLQLLIAAPEDKRATFTEVLDTIVTVNKSPDGASVYIDSEFPGDLARTELGAINPERVGVEGFRKDAAAAE